MPQLSVRALAGAALLALAACAESPVAPATSAAPTLAKGSSGGTPTNFVSVGGSWSGQYGATTAAGDSTIWSLFLNQRDDRIESGSLTSVRVINGATFVGVTSIKRGFVSGNVVSVEFDRGEGAETATTFVGEVSADGRTMTGFRSLYPLQVTLTKR